MWDLRTANPLGSLPMRKLVSFVAALIVAVFAYNLFIPTAHAASEAAWNGSSIQYEGSQYLGPATVTSDTGPQLAEKTTYYQYIEATTSPRDVRTKAHVIYFAPGSDPGKATKATYRVYDYNTDTKDYSNPTAPKQITIDASTANSSTSSCVIDAVGWIVCPLTNFLASGMDWIFNILTGFLAVQPVQTSQDTALYRAWNIMRGIANIAFVIAFLIIIYSQLTNAGVSNYGLKKLAPRLIVAAILVNVSYFICSIAVDISNILGYSIQDIFINMRNLIVGGEGNDWNVVNWQSLATLILGGGAAAVGIAAGLHTASVALAGAVSGGIYLLLPVLLAGLLAVLVVIAILAARQALITILIVLAPLAFVAYLLPNTEKWFEKWRETFMTMLVLFPIFSVIFGGSQLAGEMIIQNANSIATIILGLAVQIAPLFVTPMLIKYGGSLLGKIAGIVNDPNKGIIDRTRNWANERLAEKNALEMRTNRERAAAGTLGRRNAFRRTALKNDNLKRNRERLKAVNESYANSLFEGSVQGERLHEAEHVASVEKERVENALKAHLQSEINVEGTALHLQNVELEASKARVAVENSLTEEQLERYKTHAGANPEFGPELSRAVNSIRVSNEDLALRGIAKQNAQHVKQKEFANLLAIEDQDDPRYAEAQRAITIAAGIDPHGAFNARADAMSSRIKMEEESLTKSLQYLNAQAINEKTTLQAKTSTILSNAISGKEDYDPLLVKAAMEQQTKEGQVGFIENALGSDHINLEDLADVIARNIGTLKEKGGFYIQQNPIRLSIQTIKAQHPEWSPDQVKQLFDEQIAAGRLETLAGSSAKQISGWKAGYFSNTIAPNMGTTIELARQYAARSGNAKDVEATNKKLEAAFANIHAAITNKDIRAEMSDREDELTQIHKAYAKAGVPLKPQAVEAYEDETPAERLLKGEPPELPK